MDIKEKLVLATLRTSSHPVRPTKHEAVKTANTKPVFILSTGRTGTNYLAKFFDSAPNTTGVHEPKPSRRLKMWSNARLAEHVSDKQMADVIIKFRQNKIRSINDGYYIESNPFLVGFAPVLDKVFPNSHTVQVVRDPREYVRSAINHGATKGLKKLLNKHLPYWHLKIDPSYKIHDPVDPVQRFSIYWLCINEFLINACENKENYHLVKFEDLFGADKRNLEGLAKDMGVEVQNIDTTPANKSRYKVAESWHEWSREDCVILHRICSPLMQKLGYGKEPEWRKIVNE